MTEDCNFMSGKTLLVVILTKQTVIFVQLFGKSRSKRFSRGLFAFYSAAKKRRKNFLKIAISVLRLCGSFM